MIVAGIDVGSENVHVVIMKEGEILAKVEMPSGIKKGEAAEQAYNEALKQAGLKQNEVERVVATGTAARRATFADAFIPDAAADARAVNWLIPSARTIIDVGGEEGRAIRVSPEGKVLDFAVNERCAAGAGTFIEAMARALELSLEEMAEISLKSTRSVPLNAQCAVFCESEVVSLIHHKTPKQDIARAIYEAIAGRIGSVARIVGLEDDIVLVGGMARSRAFVEALKQDLRKDVKVPNNPEFIGAIGAAIAAAAGVVEADVKAKVIEKEKFAKG